MKTLCLGIVVMLLGSLMGGVAGAQQIAAPPVTISITMKDADVRDVIKKIAEKADTRVEYDSTVTGKVSLDVKKVTVGEALTELCKQAKLEWRKVYLAAGTASNPDNISLVIRTLDAVEATGLIALQPGGQKATAFMKSMPVSPEYAASLSKNAQYTPVYLVYNPKVLLGGPKKREADKISWKTGEPMNPEQYVQVNKEIMGALLGMSPEERQYAIRSVIESQLELLSENPQIFQMMMREGIRMQTDLVLRHPDLLQGIMQEAMQAQIDLIRSMTPQQRQEMMQRQMELIKAIPPEQMQELMQLFGPGGTR